MASTYSPLKIQLMTTGENLSTWGTVTNTNLGTALEEAIVGSADVTFSSGNVTLTLTDTNSTQTARNLRLNLVGTTGGSTRTLTVPDIEKIYLVNNTCADAVEVKNSTGSNVSVPAGKTMWVYSTGSNVVDAITHLSSLSTPSLTATNVTATNIAATTVNATTLNATTVIGGGSDITNINASNITTGTLANARTTASSSNGSSTLVVRDASGNFSANVITADGSAITALNASSISSGTIANARTTASSSNGASTIVARDASGNFSANTVTANLTGTAANATVLQTARTIGISGGATGTATSFNGSANITIPVTALNVSTASAGTLAVARGGTGVTSVGTSGNVLTSNGSAWVSTAPSVALSSFTGSNQNLSASGYQKLPGGLIIQWGAISSTQDGPQTFNFPIAFPSACVFVNTTVRPSGVTPITFNTTSFDLDRDDTISGTFQGYFIALGY